MKADKIAFVKFQIGQKFLIIRIFAAFCLMAAFWSVTLPASAQDGPDTVAYALEQYRSAKSGGDRAVVVEAAHALWQTAEDELGEHSYTGSFAHIYALNAKRLAYTPRREKRIRKAFKRAVDLAFLDADEPMETSLKRRLNWLDYDARVFHDGRNDRLLARTGELIEQYGYRGTGFDADLRGLIGRYKLYEGGELDESIRALQEALRMYETLGGDASRRSMLAYASYLKALATTGRPLIEQAMAAQRYANAAIAGGAGRYDLSEAIRYYSNAVTALRDAEALDQAKTAGFIVRPIG